MSGNIAHLAARIVEEDLPADRLQRLVEVVRHVDGAQMDDMEAVEERVDELADEFPDARIVILGRGDDPEWFVIDVHKGQTRWVKLADSAQRDEWIAPPRLERGARIPAPLTDEDVAVLTEKGVDVDRYRMGSELYLAWFREDPDLLDDFLEIVTQRLDPTQPDRNLRLRTEDGARWVILAPDHFELHPLYPHPVTVDARLKEAVRALLDGAGNIGVTDEELRQRVEGEQPDGPDPDELETLIKRARKAAHTRRKGDVPKLLEMLDISAVDEPLVDELRKHVYRGITWHDTPEVRDVLARAIAEESDDVYKTLEHVMWRQRDFLAEWLPDQLADAEGEYRDRLLALREKHVGSR